MLEEQQYHRKLAKWHVSFININRIEIDKCWVFLLLLITNTVLYSYVYISYSLYFISTLLSSKRSGIRTCRYQWQSLYYYLYTCTMDVCHKYLSWGVKPVGKMWTIFDTMIDWYVCCLKSNGKIYSNVSCMFRAIFMYVFLYYIHVLERFLLKVFLVMIILTRDISVMRNIFNYLIYSICTYLHM